MRTIEPDAVSGDGRWLARSQNVAQDSTRRLPSIEWIGFDGHLRPSVPRRSTARNGFEEGLCEFEV